jgi:hypothetical protein
MHHKNNLFFLIFLSCLIYCKGTSTDELLTGSFIPGPVIKNIQAVSETEIELTYDQKMHPGEIIKINNYSITNQMGNVLLIANIQSIPGSGNQILNITTDFQESRMTYSLTVKNVKNQNGLEVARRGITAKFIGFNTETDKSPIDLLAPNDKSIIEEGQFFIWSKRSGAITYKIEISEFYDFSTLVLEKELLDTTYQLDYNDLIGLTELNALTYYWRVMAFYKDETVTSKAISFNILDDDIIYVDVNSFAVEQFGNKSAPFKSIQAGIENAKLIGKNNVYISEGIYNEEVLMRQGINILGGYDPSDWTRDIKNNETAIFSGSNIVIKCAREGTEEGIDTTIEGFSLNIDSGTISHVIYNWFPSLIIKNNTINASGDGQIYGIINYYSSAVINNNKINIFSSAEFGTFNYGIYNLSSSSVIFNNVISIQAGNTISIPITSNSSDPIITHNILYSSSGVLANIDSSSTITNNIFLTSYPSSIYGITDDTFGICENCTATSIENNVFWDAFVNGILIIYKDIDNGCGGSDECSLSQMEILTDWAGGPDKARGNIQLPTGAGGNPFVNFPLFFDMSAGSSGVADIINIGNGNCINYTIGHYIEWKKDGIAREVISCINSGAFDDLEINPPLPDIAENVADIQIRYWGNNTNFTFDFHLQQNLLNDQTWWNLIYGGKDTSSSNCGGPASGPGTGPGGGSCGDVTLDIDGNNRTKEWPSGKDPDNYSINNSPAPPRPKDEQASPAGFSIGAYEQE